MATKIRDIAVKTGEYQDAQGQTKGRYQNVGALMKGDNGEFIVLQRWFNPAGVINPENRESVVLSCFRVEPRGQQTSPQNQQPAPQPGADSFDDEIPF